MKPEDFIQMPIPASMFTAVCALLGGVTAVPAGNVAVPRMTNRDATELAEKIATAAPIAAEEQPETVAEASPPAIDGVVDAHGWPWSADLHASTRGKTKDGLWRMKVGVQRPDPKPGFPIEDAGSTFTANTGETEFTLNEDAPTPAASTTETEDDEFAAFRAASEKIEAAVAEAPVPVRKWTDADLGALCNQAAVKLGDPVPIKALIEQFVTDGEVPHSRNIAADRREEFAVAVEAKAGIQFAG